jgi:hypothetical protein
MDDGCGGTITCDVAEDGCPDVEGGTAYDQCVDNVCTCVAVGDITCVTEGFDCGSTTNECGEYLACGAGETCGCPGSDECEDNVCTPPACVPVTCETADPLGTVCNLNGNDDGCGGTFDCGACSVVNYGCTAENYCQCPPEADPCGDAGAVCGSVEDRCGNTVDCGGTAACVTSDGCQYVCSADNTACELDDAANGCINEGVNCGAGTCCEEECGCGFDCVTNLCVANATDVCTAYTCNYMSTGALGCTDFLSADGWTAAMVQSLCEDGRPADKVIYPTMDCAEVDFSTHRCEAYSVTAPLNPCDDRMIQYLYAEALPAVICDMYIDGVDTTGPWPAY